MRFTSTQLFRFVAWCSVISLGISLFDRSFTFLLATGLAFLTIPWVMRGTTYSTVESRFLTLSLNGGLLFSIGLASKLLFGLESPTVLQLVAATVLFWAAITVVAPDPEKNAARLHRLELSIPAFLGFACIFFAPIVATPGGRISAWLQLGCLLGCCLASAIYVHVLGKYTKHA